MGKSRKLAVVTNATPASTKLPKLAAAGAGAVSVALAFVIVGWGAFRSATTARA